LDIHHPLPQGEKLDVTAQLERIDDNGRRAVITQKLVTGTKNAPSAIEARIYAVVPLNRKGADEPKKRKEPARVPTDAKLLTEWRLAKNSGLKFAALTGDFNPIHWIPAVARANGFKSTILHGFSTMARSMEGLESHYLLGSRSIKWIDVQFTRPLVLPKTVGLFVNITEDEKQVFVGDALGGPAYMTGTFDVLPSNTERTIA
jgi:acyl dehydratase